jgi:hypothetical protein
MKRAILLVAVILSACAPSVQSVQTAIAETQSVWTPIPTQTPYPTYTPFPTATLIPSPTTVPTPDSQAIIAGLIAAFKAAGLEAESPAQLGVQDYGMAPFVCFGVRILIPSLGPNKGGRLFVCDDAGEQAALAGYYQALGKGSAAFYSWVFVKGNVIVQINGTLPETIARQYESILNATAP